jgi:hypothetical protein
MQMQKTGLPQINEVDAGQALAERALITLAEMDTAGAGVALTRLAKRLSVRVSVLIRLFTHMSDAALGGVPGPGWVRLQADEAGHWRAWITPAGRGFEEPR